MVGCDVLKLYFAIHIEGWVRGWVLGHLMGFLFITNALGVSFVMCFAIQIEVNTFTQNASAVEFGNLRH